MSWSRRIAIIAAFVGCFGLLDSGYLTIKHLQGSYIRCGDDCSAVLGSKYAHLRYELLLMVGGAVVGSLTGTFWALNASKAWVAGAWLYIPLTLATQIALIPYTNFSSVTGVLMFNLLSAVPNLLLNAVLSYRGFRSFHPASA